MGTAARAAVSPRRLQLQAKTTAYLLPGVGSTLPPALEAEPAPCVPAQAAAAPSVPPLQDSHPLASLPLLGYSLTIPSESENIHKDYVFKLHFKSHVYYFRAESEYTFER